MEIRSIGLRSVHGRTEAAWVESLRRVGEKPGDLRASAHTGAMARNARLEYGIRGTHQAMSNLQDAWNLAATAEGGTRQILEQVHRLRDLSVQAAQGIWTEDQRSMMMEQVRQTLQGIQGTAIGTEYNTRKVLLGDDSGETSGIPTTDTYGPRGQAYTRTLSPSVTGLGASDTEGYRLETFSVSDPVDIKHITPRWSADGTMIRATRILDNGSTQTVTYDPAGSTGLSPPGGTSFDAVARTTVTIGGELWQLSNRSNGNSGSYGGLYARKGTDAWTRVLAFSSGSAQFTFSPTGDRIAVVQDTGSTAATIQVHAFSTGPPPSVGAGTRVNADGDTAGIPQTYPLSGFNLYQLPDGSPSVSVSVTSTRTGVARNIPYDATGTNGYSVDYVAKTITFHGSGLLDSNDTLSFSGVSGGNGTDAGTGVPYVQVDLAYAPVQYQLGSVAGGLSDSTVRSTTNASVIVSTGGNTVAYDPTGTNGWSFSDNNSIRIHGNARPAGSQAIRVAYRTDYNVAAGGNMTPRNDDGDGAVDLVFAETPETYGLDDATAAQAIAGLRDGNAVRAVSAAAGGVQDLIYDAASRTLTFRGTSQGTLSQSLGVRYYADTGLAQDTDGILEVQLGVRPDYWGLASPDGAGLANGAGSADPDAVKVITNGVTRTSGWSLDTNDTRRIDISSPSILPTAMSGSSTSIRAWVDNTANDDWTPTNLTIPAQALNYGSRSSVEVTMDGVALAEDTSGSGSGFRTFAGHTRLEVLDPKKDASVGSTTFRISYAVAGDNTFLLTIPQGSLNGCETGFPVSPTGLLVDEDTLTVTANGGVVPRSSSLAGDGWYLHPPVPGTIYKGIQLYSEYKVELVGAHALTGDGNNVRITYDRLDPSTTGALRLTLQGGARATDTQTWQLEATTVETLGLGGICLMDATEAAEAIGLCDGAIEALTRRLNRLGAYMNRVGHQTAALGTQGILTQRSQSDLVDADVAREAVIQARQRILMDSARAMAAMDLERLRDRAKLLTG